MLALVAVLAQSVAAPAFDLERALEAVRAEAAAADVGFLASPSLAGRRATTPGASFAAAYLRARAYAAGLEPGTTAGYAHRFDLDRRGIDVDACRLTVAQGGRSTELVPGRDYVFDREAAVGAAETKGRWTAGPRAEADAWYLFVDEGRSLLRAARDARRRGAAGLIAVRPKTSGLRPFEDKFAALWREVAEGRLQLPSAGLEVPEPSFPVVCVTRAGERALRRFLGYADPWTAFEPAADLVVTEVRTPDRRTLPATNVVALWPGRNPAAGCVVVCAHYDHVGVDDGRVYPGADDNASGCAALALVGDALTAGGALERSVVLLWTTAEELGLWGAEAWARDPRLPGGLRPLAAINLDMVGRTSPEHLEITPSRLHPRFNAVAELCYDAAGAEEFGPLRSQDAYWSRSDHFALAEELEIPVAYLSSGDHADYHEPTDVAAKIDTAKVARVARVVVRTLAALDEIDPTAEDGTRDR